MTPDGAGKAQGIRKDAWKAASLRSTFGTQCLGGMESAPACGFGSSVRDAGNKVLAGQLSLLREKRLPAGQQAAPGDKSVPDALCCLLAVVHVSGSGQVPGQRRRRQPVTGRHIQSSGDSLLYASCLNLLTALSHLNTAWRAVWCMLRPRTQHIISTWLL